MEEKLCSFMNDHDNGTFIAKGILVRQDNTRTGTEILKWTFRMHYFSKLTKDKFCSKKNPHISIYFSTC